MTWYAYHLFAEASPSLLTEILVNPVMSKGVYWVRDLSNYPWHDSRVKHDNPDYHVEAYPPQAFLQYLKQLSIDDKTTLAFYHCSMWGGDTDIEFAWVFKNGNEVAYSGVGFRESPNVIKEYRQSGESIERKGDVLMDTLSHFSINLPTSFFALHTRGFQWEAFKVENPKLGVG